MLWDFGSFFHYLVPFINIEYTFGDELHFWIISWVLLDLQEFHRFNSLIPFSNTNSKADTNRMDTINSIIEMIWSFFAIFIFCECGNMVTNRFDKFHGELWQCDWYLFEIELQQIYLMFMTNAQQSAMIKGHANILCTRETFKKVILFFKF